jgi:uncharacterized damage-inducible protein DinB
MTEGYVPVLLTDHFRAMARNNALANARLLKACEQLTPAEFIARRVSFFPSLCQTLNHILVVDRYYLADLQGTGRILLENETPYTDLPDLIAAQTETDRGLIEFCDGLEESELERIVPIDRKDGVAYRETVVSILPHLFQHQIHHRGQVHAMLAGTRIPPPQLDEFFLLSDSPQRDKELQEIGLKPPA